jgi:integrase
MITSMKVSKKTRHNVVMELFSIMTAARKRGHPVAPVVRLKDLEFPLDQTENEPFCFTAAQMKAILRKVARRPPWDTFFLLLPLSGTRSGEILGLRVSDLNFDANLIHIRQSVWRGKIQTLKTRASKNSVHMTSGVRARLLEYLKTHKHELLFVNRNGRPYSRDKVVAKVLHPILHELGINHKGRRCGLHAFRHGLASLLASIRASVAVAQRQMRHKDLGTTLGYTHVVGDELIDAMEEIQSLLMDTSEN